jgi:two-component system sensor histidine kinase HydH
VRPSPRILGLARASEIIARGQADLLHDGIRFSLGRRPVDAAELASVLDAYEDDGLVYVAALDREGHVATDAGRPSVDRAALEAAVATMRPGTLVDVGERVRVLFRWGPRRPRFALPPGEAPPPALVIELEPRIASQLAAGARRTFTVGVVAAAVFLLLALVRWLLLREAREKRREHERRLASLGQMSAVLAHEIKNSLASLKGNLQLLARGLPADDDKARKKAARVVDEVGRLEALTNDLLTFARTGELRRAEVDPEALVRDVVAGLDPEGARVRVTVDGAPARAALDGDRVKQVLRNLVENALHAGGEGAAPVEGSVGTERGRLAIDVRDHGPGIAVEDLPRLFEPFFTTKTHGTGLGLAVARSIVELHGGTIAADNDAGGGARFRVRLPMEAM